MTFAVLFEKFINGQVWLEKKYGDGVDVRDAYRRWQRDVVKPLDEQFSRMSEDEKKRWLAMMRTALFFKGATVVDRSE